MRPPPHARRNIGPEQIVEISGILPEKDCANAVRAIKDPASTFDSVRRAAREIIMNGYGVTGVLERVRGEQGCVILVVIHGCRRPISNIYACRSRSRAALRSSFLLLDGVRLYLRAECPRRYATF